MPWNPIGRRLGSMTCATGHCGHCQLGPLFICKDGPVLRRDVVGPLMRVAEL